MEPEVVQFLKRIALSLLTGLVLLCINAAAALKGDNAFIEGDIRLRNILFYTWFVISLVLLLWIFKKLWRKKEGDKSFYD